MKAIRQTTAEGRISLRTFRSLALALILVLSLQPHVHAAGENAERERASDQPPIGQEPPTQQLPSPTQLEGEAVRVIDGATIEINLPDGRREMVRLLQIEVPTGSCAPEAAALVRKLVLGKTVRLELGNPERDGDGRLLAYVYANGKSVQQALLNEGLAKVAANPGNGKYAEQYRVFEDHAKTLEKGIWASAPCKKADRTKDSVGEKKSPEDDSNPGSTLEQSKSGNSGGRLPNTGTDHPTHALLGAGLLLIGLLMRRSTA